jgi:hypothetical protein
MIMPSNNTAGLVHYLAGAYPGKIGMLISSNGKSNKPPFYMPYAIDNGCFTGFEEDKFFIMIREFRLLHAPLWVVCPDMVGDHEATLDLWNRYSAKIKSYGYKTAFACQDDCEPQNVPTDADVCFVGGSTEWKLSNAHKFKSVAKWLHIGRVSTGNRLIWAKQCGADSVDGTGYFRSRKQRQDMVEFIIGEKQCSLF